MDPGDLKWNEKPSEKNTELIALLVRSNTMTMEGCWDLRNEKLARKAQKETEQKRIKD